MEKVKVFFIGCGVLLMSLQSCGTNETETEPVIKETIKFYSPDDIVRVGNSKTGFSFTNKAGDTLFNNRKYSMVSTFRDGYCIVTKNENGKALRGVIDLSGREVVPVKFTEFIGSYFEGGYFRITKNGGGSGIIDSTGKVLIKPIYQKGIGGIMYDQAIVQNSDLKWGSVSSVSEKPIIDFKYDKIGFWSDERALLKYANGKFGFADPKGNVISKEEYDFAQDFENGIALVQKDGLIGFVDVKGNTAIDFQFTDCMVISDVEQDRFNNLNYIKKNEYFMMEEGYIILEKNGKWGYINAKGETVVPFEFEKISVLARGSRVVGVTKDGVKGNYYIDENRFEEVAR